MSKAKIDRMKFVPGVLGVGTVAQMAIEEIKEDSTRVRVGHFQKPAAQDGLCFFVASQGRTSAVSE